MTDTENGGAAFPFHGNANAPCTSGMSLRDWFAGRALAGMLSQDSIWLVEPDHDRIAKACYHIADALLKFRKPTP